MNTSCMLRDIGRNDLVGKISQQQRSPPVWGNRDDRISLGAQSMFVC